LFRLGFGEPIEDAVERFREIEIAEADVVANVGERGVGGRFVGGEVEHELRSVVVFRDGDAVSGGEAVEERVRRLHVDGGEEVDGGAGFDEEEDFGGLDDVGEIGDGLLDAVVEDVEVFAAEVGNEVALGVGDDDANVDAIDGDLDGGGL